MEDPSAPPRGSVKKSSRASASSAPRGSQPKKLSTGSKKGSNAQGRGSIRQEVDTEEAAKLPDPVDSLSDRLEKEPEPIAGFHDEDQFKPSVIPELELDCPCGPECTCSLPEVEEEEEEEEGAKDKVFEDDGEGEEEEEEEEDEFTVPVPDYAPQTNLSDFDKAKEYFMTASTKTGISLYDHFSMLIRQLLDVRAPDNPVDFAEELSLNLKRFRFGLSKDVPPESYCAHEARAKEMARKLEDWKGLAMWSSNSQGEEEQETEMPSSPTAFPNLLRLQYYLEQINVGLPRADMYKIAQQLRAIKMQHPIVSRVRFWGKVYGTQGNYYIFEAETEEGQAMQNPWIPPMDEEAGEGGEMEQDEEEEEDALLVPGPTDTVNRAGAVVLDRDFLSAYEPPKRMIEGKKNSKDIPEHCKKPDEEEEEMLGEGYREEEEYPGEDQPVGLTEEEELELAKWREYIKEVTTEFPKAVIVRDLDVPLEEVGHGVNRRIFLVWSEKLGRAIIFKSVLNKKQDWNSSIISPLGTSGYVKPEIPEVDDLTGLLAMTNLTTPQHINTSRQIRWFLTGDLNAKIRTVPPFPGREGDYLRALLSRITASASVSPKGYYRTKKPAGDDAEEMEEEEEEDVEEEEEERLKEDIVFPVKKFRPENIQELTQPPLDGWVHHANHILRQGRTDWINMELLKTKKRSSQKNQEEEDEEDFEDEFGEEEEDEEIPGLQDKEVGPKLFSSLEQDVPPFDEKVKPWSARPASTVFTEFQVATARSNLWPGANAICTAKGKVESIYFGDGLKFQSHSYAPPLPIEPQSEYKDGPELTELDDPTVQAEEEWLAKLRTMEEEEQARAAEGEEEEEEEEED